MVSAPIIPDQAAGLFPLWGSDGAPVNVDALLGKPTAGKDDLFCDPSYVVDGIYGFGSSLEVVVFFNEETRLVEQILLRPGYKGRLEGPVQRGRETLAIQIQPRFKVKLGTSELTEYAYDKNQAEKPNSWLNHDNITAIYWMIQQTFFNPEETKQPLPAGFNCVEDQLCDIIFTAGADPSIPQVTAVRFLDSGITLQFAPDGIVTEILMEPVRIAPFERAGVFSFLDATQTRMAPRFVSSFVPDCAIELAQGQTWAQFQRRCVTGNADEQKRILNRINYSVATQRDAVSAGFNGADLSFMRPTSQRPVFQDGDRPEGADSLLGVTLTRSMSAKVSEFVARDLAQAYVRRLANLVNTDLVARGAPGNHPLWNLETRIGSNIQYLSDRPQRIGELFYRLPSGEQVSWLPEVIETVRGVFARLSPEQRRVVSPNVGDPVYLIEPFVRTVMKHFTLGATDRPDAVVSMRSTNNQRWSIGLSDFVVDGVPFRLVVQYSLNYGAVTAVTIERGRSEVDSLFDRLNALVWVNPAERPLLYNLSAIDVRMQTNAARNPFRLGGRGIQVGAPNRELGMVRVRLAATLDGSAQPTALQLWVPGTRIEDREGFLRQVAGERFEFVAAHEVMLYGKETQQVFHVSERGAIVRIELLNYSGAPRLCEGVATDGSADLRIGYGDDIRAKAEAWRARVGERAYRDCNLVFNYSEDGRVLSSVASLQYRIAFGTQAGRSTSVARWL